MILLENWKGILVIFLYLGGFTLTGTLLPERIHKNSMLNSCLIGFMVYFSVFQIVALPMKILGFPLKYLTITWVVFLGIVVFINLVFRRKNLKKMCANILANKEKLVTGLLFLGTVGLLALYLGYNVNHISDFDAGYYIGLPVSSVYSNTIELMDPYSGQMLNAPNAFYLLNTNTIHSAVIFQALNLHPLVEEKFSMTIVLVILFGLFLYKGGLLLFDRNRKKSLVFSWISLLVLLCSYSIAGVSHYFAYRTYEGKAVTSYLYMTAIFVYFLGIFREKEKEWGWSGVFFAGLSGVAFCNTAIFVIPAMITILLIPYMVIYKKWKTFFAYVISMIPCVFWISLHILM